MKRNKNNTLILLMIMFIIFIFITTFSIMKTYAKYYEELSTNFSLDIKKWLIQINDEDILGQKELKEILPLQFKKNDNINDNKFVPGAIAYFDIILDCSYVDLDFKMKMEMEQTNANKNLDYKIIGYQISDDLESNAEQLMGDLSNITKIENIEIESPDFLDKEVSNKKRILVFFEWNDKEDNNMNDEADTNYEVSETNEAGKKIIKTNIKFLFTQI